jgi:hypothetical protein
MTTASLVPSYVAAEKNSSPTIYFLLVEPISKSRFPSSISLGIPIIDKPSSSFPTAPKTESVLFSLMKSEGNCMGHMDK